MDNGNKHAHPGAAPQAVTKSERPGLLAGLQKPLLFRRATRPGKEFEDGFGILKRSFPPKELETKDRLAQFLADRDFHFDAVYEEERAVGVHVWRVAPSIGIHDIMVAVDPPLRNRGGIGTRVYELGLREMQACGFGPETIIFSEIEIPHKKPEDETRDVIRPGFHGEKTLLFAAEGVEYNLPDLQQEGAAPEKMLLCFRTLGGAIQSLSSRKIAEAIHWLYFSYYHRIYGIPQDQVRPLFERSAFSLLGRSPTGAEISKREAFMLAAPETEIKLRKISELAID